MTLKFLNQKRIITLFLRQEFNSYGSLAWMSLLDMIFFLKQNFLSSLSQFIELHSCTVKASDSPPI